MTGYEYNGEYIEKQEAIDYIKKRIRTDLNDRQVVEEFFEDLVDTDDEVKEQLLEFFFDGPAKMTDPKEEAYARQIDEEYEREIG
ncbi:MAG: hypothetical protein PHD56_14545 [Anaerostipes sp.]|jgi:hypothetical protein|nr:hypothetical protein [Anaerostipes sp.]